MNPLDHRIPAVKALLVLGLVSACTVKNPLFCETDVDCAGTDKPFCDADGEFPASNDTRNTCIEIPADCSIERCGCTPGNAFACDLDQLTVCGADGKSTTTSTCALGCSTEKRCLTFEPSNGLGPALDIAAGEPDVIVPSGARVDTELGLIQDAAGTPISVRSLLVSQESGTMIRAFVASSFVIDAVRVRGANSVAFVASGRITIRGTLDARAEGQSIPGPGAQRAPAGCIGAPFLQTLPSILVLGGGGGGNSTPGGTGRGVVAGQLGGSAVAGTALVGGCGAGDAGSGGAGGGAIQLVSMDEIALSTAGLIDVGGGGGGASNGGGSGGLVVLEAPHVRIDGAASGIVANGGAGGGCLLAGSDATSNSDTALAPQCTGASAGDGGTGFQLPGSGEVSTSGSAFKGGGGGAAGRARIATKQGAFEALGNPVISAQTTQVALTPR